MLKVKSHTIDSDESFVYTFDQAGTYDYICGLHPHMHGQIVVAA
jgi:plastocyanin